MSSWPVNAPPTAPKLNISVLPRKKATTVVITADTGVRANLVKFGVAVPPEANDPTTSPIPTTRGMPVEAANTSLAPPPSRIALDIDQVASPAINRAGVEPADAVALMPEQAV